MKLTPLALRKLNAKFGAGSLVTANEFKKKQITVVKDEKQVVFEVIAPDSIFRGAVLKGGMLAQHSFAFYKGARRHGTVTPNLVFPKPAKDELRIYLKDDGFNPPAGSVWYLFLTDTDDLAIGFCTVKEFEALQYGLIATVDLKEDEGDTDNWVVNAISERIERSIKARRGQTKFRNNLLKIYNSRCCITDCAVIPVLEAAHIELLRGADNNDPGNGLLLRSDIHTLFDLGLIKIRPDLLTVELDGQLRNSQYSSLQERKLKIPSAFLPRLNINGLRTRYDS